MKALPATQLVQSINKTADRYTALRVVFTDFCTKATALASNKEVHGVDPKFDGVAGLEVRFCGNVYLFKFTMEHAKGVVTCTLRNQESEMAPAKVGLFTFNKDGDTDVQGAEDALNMKSVGDAPHLVLHMIYQDAGKALSTAGG
jgi:hypothetical protein